MNEKSWERTDKGGSSTESFDLRGRVSLLFLCSFLCRRVIAYLLSSSSKKKSTTTLHGGKSIFWERIPTFHLKRILVPVGEFVSIKIESSLLFFFGLQKHVRQHNVSRASICEAQPIMTLGSHEIDRRNFDR